MEDIHPLKAWRADRGLTLKAAAVILGFPKPSLSRFETGARTPSLAQAAKLSEQTGIPIFKFLMLRQPADEAAE